MKLPNKDNLSIQTRILALLSNISKVEINYDNGNISDCLAITR